MAHLLLVDDDNNLVKIFGALLRSEGHDVRTACTGEEGLKVLRAALLPDVVVLDVDMPILDGPGMAHQMVLHDAGEEKIPVILVSGRVDLVQIARRMGTTYFVQKPADFGKFLSVLSQALSERLAPSSA
jgi:DNA-binding NtrC family response regulator